MEVMDLRQTARSVAALVRRLVQGLLNQFDMFDPKAEIYGQVLDHWKNLQT